MCETICLLNMKGGVGKTTLAVTLAWHISRTGGRVLLVDFDPQYNASQYLMRFDGYKTHLKEKGTIAGLLIDSPQPHPANRSPHTTSAEYNEGPQAADR